MDLKVHTKNVQTHPLDAPRRSRGYSVRSGMSGEFDFIHWVRKQVAAHDHVLVPPGDDLAVLKWPADDLLIVGVDQVLDGVHFESDVHTPRDIGRKVMNRNLSDCAAMACLPAAAVATVALPKARGIDYAKQLFLGMKVAAEQFDCAIVGGDTASWDAPLALTVSILGKSAGIKPITRSGAKPGDQVYVTGPLGGSLLGRHVEFTPRVNEAIAIAKVRRPTAMIDLSDGLSRDLGHICRESNVAAMVFEEQLPIHRDAIEMRPDGRTPLDHALHDGEDHELLFTTAPEYATLFPPPVASTVIGMIAAGVGVWLQRRDGGRESLVPRGWEHGL